MLRALGLVVALGACTADIAPSTYYCGPEGLCPDGLACNMRAIGQSGAAGSRTRCFVVARQRA